MYGDSTNPVVYQRWTYILCKSSGDERELYDKLIQIDSSSEFVNAYKSLKSSTFMYQDQLVGDWNSVELNLNSTNAYGDTLFFLE